ncbi:MAG: TRAP transporter large permease subunit [Deltaproteobacteria bacterium]|nr:TRAP transporter large permease subunit [Deltaproteobacteria bacterium]
MEWQVILLIIFGSLLITMVSGMPIALCFFLINVVGSYALFGGMAGLEQLIFSMYSSLATFSLLPLPLFILMGEVLYHSNLGPILLDVLDKLLGRVPGRLALLSVAGGALLSVLTGASVGSVAMLGNTLVPEMEERGYKKAMSLGPILGSGGLAIMIPPSGLAVLLGAIGEISIGKILIAIIVPGLMMAALYAAYVIVRCWLQPSVGPSHEEVSQSSFLEKIITVICYVLPLGIIVFLVTGVIILGVATPSEAAATGTLGVVFLAAAYRLLTWEVLKKAIGSTLEIMGMIFLIICGAKAFSSLLSFTGVTVGVGEVLGNMSPVVTVITTQVIVLIMGAFMEPASIMMITLPIFIPVITALGFSPVWFAVVFLLSIEMSLTTPPFGLNLFVMKGVAPSDTTMKDIYLAGFPFLACDAIVMVLLITFPEIALWLPSMTK